MAVCLMHSYTFPDHEKVIGEIAEEIGFSQISLSSVAAPSIKIVPRGHAAVADAYLTPEIKKYIDGFVSGFEDLENCDCRCEFMQSDGGLVEFKRYARLAQKRDKLLTECIDYQACGQFCRARQAEWLVTHEPATTRRTKLP